MFEGKSKWVIAISVIGFVSILNMSLTWFNFFKRGQLEEDQTVIMEGFSKIYLLGEQLGKNLDTASKEFLRKMKHLDKKVDDISLQSELKEKLENLEKTVANLYRQSREGNGPELFPKKSLTERFPSKAVQEEIRKHDRIIVDGMSYIDALLNREKTYEWWNQYKDVEKNICLVLLTGERQVPYIDATLSLLLRGNTRDELFNNTDIHIHNIEKREDHIAYPHLNHDLAKFPFLTIHHTNTKYDANTTFGLQGYYYKLLSFTLDYLKSVEICLQTTSKYCLIVEDDTIPTINLMKKLNKYVIPELKKGKHPFIALWHCAVGPYDGFDKLYGIGNLANKKWADENYEGLRAKYKKERLYENGPKDVEYKVVPNKYPFGTVAYIFTREGAQGFIDFMKKQDLRREYGVDQFLNVDYLVGRERQEIQPSLFNHIGFYSARMYNQDKPSEFNQLATDITFNLDDD